jgi:hypothetical protein
MKTHAENTPATPPRLKLAVLPQFQRTLLYVNGGLLFGLLCLGGLQIHLSFESFLSQPDVRQVFTSPETLELFRALKSMVLRNFLVMTLFLVMISALVSILVSHRLAGPIVRVYRYFERMIDKPYPRETLAFRDGDYISDLAPIVNQALDRLTHATPPAFAAGGSNPSSETEKKSDNE